MIWLYALNWWYDDRREPLRFLMFAAPCLLSAYLMVQDDFATRMAGSLLFAAMAVIRIIPSLFRRKRPPRSASGDRQP